MKFFPAISSLPMVNIFNISFHKLLAWPEIIVYLPVFTGVEFSEDEENIRQIKKK